MLGRPACLLLILAWGCGFPADQRQEEALIGAHDRDYAKVSKAQMIMMYSGFATYVDGLMGPETRDTLKKFQKSRGIPPSGYISDNTWSALMQLERRHGPFDVERLQRGLKKAGFDPGAIDGQAGGMTSQALARFQQAKGLKATGKVNPPTWAALRGWMPRQPVLEASDPGLAATFPIETTESRAPPGS